MVVTQRRTGGQLSDRWFQSVRAGALGVAVVATATCGQSKESSLTGPTPSPVASLALVLDSLTAAVGAQIHAPAVIARDSIGAVLAGYPITWRSTDTTVVQVDTSGLVTARSVGRGGIIASAGAHADTLYLTIVTVAFTRITGGAYHACGVTTQQAAFCWGAGGGTATLGLKDAALIVSGPVMVPGLPPVMSVATGWEHNCALTAAGVAYCWGDNSNAQLGSGKIDSTPHGPVAVSGGLTFTSLAAGPYHTCGLLSSGAAYCWGYNATGENGHNPTGTFDASPAAVGGGLMYLSLTAGLTQTCGIGADSTAYCWGDYVGSTPTAIATGTRFRVLAAGQQFTCGVASSGSAYCWGLDTFGQLGDSTQDMSLHTAPHLVSGGLTFTAVFAGGTHACGLTSAGTAYCWGDGRVGELGDGQMAISTTPVAVSGGLSFLTLGGANGFTFGIASTGVAYTWGGNTYGDLGLGTTPVVYQTTPARVVGQP